MALNTLGDFMRTRGNMDEAALAYQQALELFDTLDFAPHGLMHNLGYVTLAKDDPRGAASLFLQAGDAYRTFGSDRRGLAECVIGLARTAARTGDLTLAARLFGSAEGTLKQAGTLLTPANRADYGRGLAVLEAAMEPKQLASERAAGRSINVDEALHQARVLAL